MTSQAEKILKLKVMNQKDSSEKIYRIQKKRLVIGSSTSADLRLDDTSVSPVHAILEVTGTDGKPVLYDLASETGVFVNQKQEIQKTLDIKDKVQIGSYFIEVSYQVDLPQELDQIKVKKAEEFKPLLLEDEREVVEIFDHSPESKQSLQVVMFFNDTILDVEHFVDKKRIVIGPGTREDFSIPPFLGEGKAGKYEFVSKQGSNYVLHLHEKMQGVLQQQGQLKNVQDLKTVSKDIALDEKGFAKVQLNDVSFFLNFSPAPPKLKSRKLLERDPLFLKIWMTSLILTLALLLVLANVQVNPTIEVEQIPERVATILYEPKPPVIEVEKPKVEEKKPTPAPTQVIQPPKVIKVEPKPITTPPKKDAMIGEKQNQKSQKTASAQKKPGPPAQKSAGNEGAGARARGEEGTRGEANKPKMAVPQQKAQRPGADKGKSVGASMPGNSQTRDFGVVDVFKSNQGTLSKLFAGGKGASNAANKLEGYSGFTSEGKGGLGAAGAGSGGGGQSMGLGGLAEKGAGGGKKGSGLGALGSGGNILGGTGKLSFDSAGGGGEPIVLGSIDSDAIARAIAAYRDQIKYCYEKEINADRPDLAGRVGVRFVIGASGSVTQAGVLSSSLKHPPTEQCILEVIRRIPFPPVKGGGVAEVSYPFVFKPSNK